MTVTSRAAILAGNQNPAEQIDMRIAPLIQNTIFGPAKGTVSLRAIPNIIHGGASQAASVMQLAKNIIFVGPFDD